MSRLSDEGSVELRRGPWTMEEDNLLIYYITCHGEGRWNNLAKCSGLKRSGKSCRLRWLNYLKPDVKRGNLTPQEQLLILELHSKWGNRWSKIAQHLPGRTDNEIKNYWRTRVIKQARHLKIDTNSTKFQDLIRSVWVPQLLEKIQRLQSAKTNYQSLHHHNSDHNHTDPSSNLFANCAVNQYIHFPQVSQVISESPINQFCADEFDIIETNNCFLEEVEDCVWNMEELWELQ